MFFIFEKLNWRRIVSAQNHNSVSAYIGAYEKKQENLERAQYLRDDGHKSTLSTTCIMPPAGTCFKSVTQGRLHRP